MAKKQPSRTGRAKAQPSPYAEVQEFGANDLYRIFDALFTSAVDAADDAEHFAALVCPNIELVFRDKPEQMDSYIEYLEGKISLLKLIKDEVSRSSKTGKTSKKNDKKD